MPKYRKKPVVIEAFQMTWNRRFDNSEWPEWLHTAWNKEAGTEGAIWPVDYPDSDTLMIGTLEGEHRISWNDYIIKGINGELYPCKPDIFDKTYELMDEFISGVKMKLKGE